MSAKQVSGISAAPDRAGGAVVIRFRFGAQVLEAILDPNAAHRFFEQYSDAFVEVLDAVGAPEIETPATKRAGMN